MQSKVYLIVTEDYYGGEEKTRIYTELSKATDAVQKMLQKTIGKLDVVIYEKDLTDPTYHKVIEIPYNVIPDIKRHKI